MVFVRIELCMVQDSKTLLYVFFCIVSIYIYKVKVFAKISASILPSEALLDVYRERGIVHGRFTILKLEFINVAINGNFSYNRL